MQAARDFAHLLEHGHEIALGLLEVGDHRLVMLRQARADLLQIEVQGEEVLLRAVVEVALEPASRGVPGFDYARA